MFESGSCLLRHGRLTDREGAAVRLLLDGRDTSEVADELAIAIHTARMHLTSARSKSGVPNLAALVAWGYAHRACCLSLPGYATSDDTITELDGVIHRLDQVLEDCCWPALLADSDNRYVLWNSAFRQLVGVDDSEIASRRLGEFSAAEQRRGLRHEASLLFDGDRREWRGSIAFERPDGSQILTSIHARALSAGGRSNAMVAVASPPVATLERDAPVDDGPYAWGGPGVGHASLTRREAEVVELLSAGLSIGATADARDRSVETIRMHVRHAREKTQARSLAALLAWWFRHANCCRSGLADSSAATDRRPATLIHKLGLALDSSCAATALFDLDGRLLIWSAQLSSVLRVTESEFASREPSAFAPFNDRTDLQATLQNMRDLLLRDSRIRVGLNHRAGGAGIPLELQLGIVGKGGKPRAYAISAHALKPAPA